FGGLLKILDRLLVVRCPLEVHRKLCRQFPCPLAPELFRMLSNPLVKLDASGCRQAVVECVLIQRMDEAVARDRLSIWQILYTQILNKMVLASQFITAGIYCSAFLSRSSRHSKC